MKVNANNFHMIISKMEHRLMQVVEFAIEYV